MKNVMFAIVIIVFVCSSCVQKKKAVPPGELDIQAMIQPIPATAKFINDTSYIWCGTLVKSHIDNKYHLFYSRWPRKYGMGQMVVLLCAVNENQGHSYNIQIPLKPQ